MAALEDVKKEKEGFTNQADYQPLDLPVLCQDLAFAYLKDPTIIDVKGFFHLKELYVTNAPILIENNFWKK